MSSIYDFTVNDADGKDVSLDKYKGKVLLIVNVASQCGFTNSNYTQMKELLDKYHDRGFEVAAFPCNQFGGQLCSFIGVHFIVLQSCLCFALPFFPYFLDAISIDTP
jgi:glutathione peroxidase-family protein